MAREITREWQQNIYTIHYLFLWVSVTRWHAGSRVTFSRQFLHVTSGAVTNRGNKGKSIILSSTPWWWLDGGWLATLTPHVRWSLIIITPRSLIDVTMTHTRGLQSHDTEQPNVRWSWRLRWEEVAHYWFYWLSALRSSVSTLYSGCCYQWPLGRWWQDDKILLPPIRNHLNVPCVQKWQIL